MSPVQLLLGLSLGGIIAFLAWRAGALNSSGAWAAAFTGGLIFGLGGFSWAVLLLTFFLSSSILSYAFHSRKVKLSEKFSKGSRRDWGQVLANGGLGMLLALAHAVQPGQNWPWLAFIGAMSAVNADTWSTELGVLSSSAPRLLITGRKVEAGTSGAVSTFGYLASLAGAALIAALALSFTEASSALGGLAAFTLAGVVGSTCDSLLGASVQAIYFCPRCGKETERHPLHTCGEATTRLRGWSWLNNDWVNFICSLVGAGTALALAGLFEQTH